MLLSNFLIAFYLSFKFFSFVKQLKQHKICNLDSLIRALVAYLTRFIGLQIKMIMSVQTQPTRVYSARQHSDPLARRTAVDGRDGPVGTGEERAAWQSRQRYHLLLLASD